MLKTIAIALFFISNIVAYTQTKYQIQDKDGFDYMLTIEVDGNKIIGHTREKALLDYTSKIKYWIVKLMSPLKYPEIIHFEGLLKEGKFEGKYYSLFSQYKINGELKGDSIYYDLYKSNGKIFKSLNGVHLTKTSNKDYKDLIHKIIQIIEENIYDPNFIQTKKWIKFKKVMRENSLVISDDLELQIGFFALVRSFHFSHYYIVKKDTSFVEKTNFELNEITPDIAVLKIRSFSGEKEAIEPLLSKIKEKRYSHLIIDLRNNPGGNFKTALPLANFLTDKVLISGFFPNNKWYKTHDRFPTQADISDFTLFDGGTMEEFYKNRMKSME